MKSLYLLRHAKSDWTTEYPEDHERPLAPRGVKAAGLVGRFLAGQKRRPGCAVTSTARRALQTLELAMATGDWSCPVVETRRVYEADATALLEIVRRQDDDVATLLLVGHEPTLSDFASRLAGGGRLRLPTAALVHLVHEGDHWRDLAFGSAELRALIPPKMLAFAKSHRS